MFKTVLFLCLLSASQVFAAKPGTPANYSYWVRLPASDVSCADEAKSLGDRLAKTLNVTLVSSVCQGTLDLHADQKIYKLYSIFVTYSSENEYLPYSAVLGTSSFSGPSDEQGVYDTYASCLDDIKSQSSLYAANTGLEALTAFCKQAQINGDPQYVLQIDGFGEPKTNLYLFVSGFMPDVDPAIYGADAERMIKAQGGVIAKNSKGAVFFYSKYTIPIYVQSMAFIDTSAHCAAQVSETQDMFVKLNGDSTVKCVEISDGGAYLQVIRIGGNVFLNDIGTMLPPYFTFDQCMNDRTQVKQNYSAQGLSVVGALCEPDSQYFGQYRLSVFRSY